MSKVGVGSILGHFAFVGWVEPIPGLVGFRCTQPNLHFAGVIANCITQQRPISEPSPKSFFFDQTGFIWAGGGADPRVSGDCHRSEKLRGICRGSS